MTDYRHEIRALIDPEHTEGLLDGGHLQLVSVIMTDHRPVDEHCPPWRPPSAVSLRPDEARRLACELLELAEQARRTRVRR